MSKSQDNSNLGKFQIKEGGVGGNVAHGVGIQGFCDQTLFVTSVGVDYFGQMITGKFDD